MEQFIKKSLAEAPLEYFFGYQTFRFFDAAAEDSAPDAPARSLLPALDEAKKSRFADNFFVSL